MKRYILLFITIIALGACSDEFLDRAPFNQKVDDNFYNTPDEAFQGLVAAYDVLQDDNYGNILLISEIASDNSFGGAGASDGFGQNYWDWFEAEHDQNAIPWEKYYQGIYRANVILSKLDGVNWGSQESLKSQYEAEARFLRAYFYFDLVRLFENVPLITEPLVPGEYEQPQADPASVYAQIAKDLKFAIENLPDVPYQQMDPSTYGRVTKWASEALMGRVFLFYTDYYEKADLAGVVSKQQARDYIDDVIDNSGHDLVPDFRTLWRAATHGVDSLSYVGEDNIETVFAIKYTFKGLGDWDAFNNGATNGNLWQKYIGLRNQEIYPYASGWGFCTVNSDLWNAYSDDDTRKTASIISIEDEIPSFNPDDQRQYTGYVWKKFMPTLDSVGQDENGNTVYSSTVVNLGGDEQLDGFDDYPVIRFSDVLLMGAELHLDGGSRAQEYFNRVRDRAFQDTDHRITVTKEAIMNERRLELAFEGHRYWDLIRQSMEVAKNAIDNESEVDELNVNFRMETGGYFKIPETQISLSNGAMQQNEGWQ